MYNRLFITKLFILFASCSLWSQWTNNGLQLSSSNSHNGDPKIAVVEGGTMVAWIDLLATGSVFLNAYDATGNLLNDAWQEGGMEISAPGGDYFKTEIITSEDGNVIVIWYGYTTTNTGMDRRHILAQKYDLQAMPIWNGGDPIQVSTNMVMHHLNPVAISDKAGGVYIAWTQTDLNLFPQSNDIYLQHLDADGEIADGWNTIPTLIAAQSGTTEHYPALALTPDHTGLYLSYVVGSINSSHYLQRINTADGSITDGWSDVGVLLSQGPNIFYNAAREPRLYTDDNGNAIAFWIEFRNAGEVYMQIVSPNGVKQFAEQGKAIILNSGEDLTYLDFYQINSDDYAVTWRETSGAATSKVFLNRFDGQGDPIWSAPYQVTNEEVAYPKVITDGQGGLYLLYKAFQNNGTDDFLCLRIDAQGVLSPDWTNSGVFIGTIGNLSGFTPQRDFQVAYSSDLNGAYVVWVRKASDGLFDVFGCNVLADGTVCAENVPTGISTLGTDFSLRIFPNPAQDIISFDFQANTRPNLIKIMDYAGREVKQLTVNKATFHISTEQLPDGLYFANMYYENDVKITQKFIVLK